jgi:hypothetical protein
MITPWTIYWITRLETLSNFFGFAAAGCVAFVFFSGVAWFFGYATTFDERDAQNLNKCAKTIGRYWLIVASIVMPLALFVPSGKEAAAMIVLPAIANNQDFQALGSELPKLAREWLEELRPSTKKAEKP